ncbi:WbuC family cupin fold metalloprotein [Crenobacter sp. SG2303]|uniref:WbuC family cupin fold metalloprotein n=1 Tax=Crenobacter oryzisoli TaxID=3056844 RepID=A0ABT7XQI8_9NEIS|nr:WbuC family cupin fold metalloprotein [Crenobacter sp. SG2303]MDN0076015.1 WbuC family cupin fold metalloprotein [Crenobacter sp. SG2303]
MLTLTHTDLDTLSATAAAAPRLRANRNFHPELSAPVQRLAIAMEPDTYVRPHRHSHSWELLTVLKGSFEVIIFDEAGVVSERILLGKEVRVLEMPANTWHSVQSCEPGSVVFEVKQGPYAPLTEVDLAAWSPAEGDAKVSELMAFMRVAKVGERYAQA